MSVMLNMCLDSKLTETDVWVRRCSSQDFSMLILSYTSTALGQYLPLTAEKGYPLISILHVTGTEKEGYKRIPIYTSVISVQLFRWR